MFQHVVPNQEVKQKLEMMVLQAQKIQIQMLLQKEPEMTAPAVRMKVLDLAKVAGKMVVAAPRIEELKAVEFQIAELTLEVPQIALSAPVESDTVQAEKAVFLCSAQQKSIDFRQLGLGNLQEVVPRRRN